MPRTHAPPATAVGPPPWRRDGSPIVIGHRGAPAYRPEHTLGSYLLAIEMGADFIEPDLVFTKDGELSSVTSPTSGHDRRRRPPGVRRLAAHADDRRHHLREHLVHLRLHPGRAAHAARQGAPARRPASEQAFDGLYPVPRFQEVIDLALANGVGICPETKHPTFFASLGFDFDQPLSTLARNGLDRPGAKVFIQSFEVGNLVRLSRRTRLPLIQLIDAAGAPADLVAAGDPRTYDDLVTPQGLRDIARYADGIGPDKSRIIAGNAAGKPLGAPTTLVDDAHRAGLLVHPFTFRPENTFLAADYRMGDPASPQYLRARGDEPAELARSFALGVDGLFADNADTAVAVREHVGAGARRSRAG